MGAGFIMAIMNSPKAIARRFGGIIKATEHQQQAKRIQLQNQRPVYQTINNSINLKK